MCQIFICQTVPSYPSFGEDDLRVWEMKVAAVNCCVHFFRQTWMRLYLRDRVPNNIRSLKSKNTNYNEKGNL